MRLFMARPATLLLLAALLLFACTLPSPGDPGALTQAAGTVAAELTAAAQAQPETPTVTGPPEQESEGPPPDVDTATVTVSVDTNCRSGPGFKYVYEGALLVGQEGQVVGKPEPGGYDDYLVIDNPDAPGEPCWAWLFYATVVGSLENVPEVPVPPVPKLSAIGGLLWDDTCFENEPGNPPPGCVEVGGELDGNAVLDAGEAGLGAGYAVHLGVGGCPSSGLDQTSTDANGQYSFDGLEAGIYCVSVRPDDPLHQSPLCGWWTYPTRGTGVVYAEVEVAAAEGKAGINFGVDKFEFLQIC